MTLPLQPPFAPMEAQLVERIPTGPAWQYEPKWDGFRCLAFRDGEHVELQSKAGQPLTRYFPEIVAHLLAMKPARFVLDGELVIEVEGKLAFDQLLQRIHPAESRVRMLASRFPASYVVFDLLVDEKGRPLNESTLEARRTALEKFAARAFVPGVLLSPATTELADAKRWLAGVGTTLDGVVAKRRDLAYRSGDRTGMQKVKRLRTADCVVGGFRYASAGGVLGSLLLGLYDDNGKLDYVGYCSSFTQRQRAELTPELEALIAPPGFTGSAPGGKSRWSKAERSTAWQPLRPERVVEVRYDHFTERFRHGTTFLRWRPDKAPRQCTYEQAQTGGALSPLSILH